MRTLLIVIGSEIRKGLLITWSYRFNAVFELIVFAFMFIVASFLIGNGDLTSAQLPATLLGYLVWFYSAAAVSNMSIILADESQAGTLEQMYMSSVPIQLILIGRMIATVITTTIQIFLVTLFLIVVMNIYIPMRLEGVVVLLLTMCELFGFGLLLGGLTLIYKHVSSLVSLIQTLLIFFTGALLSVDHFPLWMQYIAQIMPGTQGIIVLRSVVLDQLSLADVWANGSLVALAVHIVVYCTLGWLFFKYCEGIAQRNGLLGHY